MNIVTHEETCNNILVSFNYGDKENCLYET